MVHCCSTNQEEPGKLPQKNQTGNIELPMERTAPHTMQKCNFKLQRFYNQDKNSIVGAEG